MLNLYPTILPGQSADYRPVQPASATIGKTIKERLSSAVVYWPVHRPHSFCLDRYAYYNNGINYGSFDQKADTKVLFAAIRCQPNLNGIAQFIEQNGAQMNNRNAGKKHR